MGLKCKQIAVDGVENFRDLGGYPARDGVMFPEGKLYRSAALHNISQTGLDSFNELGIEYIVDLRSMMEIDQNPEETKGMNGTTYVHIPMFDNLNSKIAEGTLDFPETMLDLYQDLMKNHQEDFLETFKVFDKSEGGVLFHCSAGKDRTGVTTMLLYGLAGVDEDTIAEDYSYSERLLTVHKPSASVPEYIMQTKKEYMLDTLAWVNEEYGGAIGYLDTIGVTVAMQENILEKLGIPRQD